MTTTSLASLSGQLRQLNDRQAVADPITRLGLMLDDTRFDDAGTILAGDVTVQTPGGSSRGPEAVVALARRNHTVRTQHVITNMLITLEGDRAEARANLIVTSVPDSDDPEASLRIGNSDQPQSRLMTGERYRFQAARGEPGWRPTSIKVTRRGALSRWLPARGSRKPIAEPHRTRHRPDIRRKQAGAPCHRRLLTGRTQRPGCPAHPVHRGRRG